MIEAIFLLAGLIIFLGFFSMLFFERTKIPDILILMFLGLFLGSILSEEQIALFNSFAPYVGAIAFMMILFNAGLNLNLVKVMKELSEVMIFMFTAFALTCFFVMVLMRVVFGWDILHGLLLGAVVGGTSSAIVISSISKISVKESSKILLSLESALSDVLCIVVSLAVIEIILSNKIILRDNLNALFGTFSIAVVVAMIVSIIWVGILKRFHGKPFGYLLTVAVIFIMYSFVEFIRGNGAISVLIFGLILGNARHLQKLFNLEEKITLDTKIKAFQKEVAFFVRTYFFVYIGIIFNSNAVSIGIFLISLAVLAVILLARYLSVKGLILLDKCLKCDEMVLDTMLPRGLAAAVLASIPLSRGIEIEYFSEIVFLTIILTNVTTTIGAFLDQRRKVAGEGKTDSSG